MAEARKVRDRPVVTACRARDGALYRPPPCRLNRIFHSVSNRFAVSSLFARRIEASNYLSNKELAAMPWVLRRRLFAPLLVLVALALGGVIALAQQKVTPQTDQEFARLVKEWTTRPEFMSPLVDHLPVARGHPVAEGHARLPRRRPGQAELLRRDPRLLPGAGGKVAARAADDDRQDRRGPRHRDRRRGLGADAEGPRPLPGIPRTARRPARPHRAAGARGHRTGQADLPRHGRAPQRRDRPVRDADGAGLPARGGRVIAVSSRSATT